MEKVSEEIDQVNPTPPQPTASDVHVDPHAALLQPFNEEQQATLRGILDQITQKKNDLQGKIDSIDAHEGTIDAFKHVQQEYIAAQKEFNELDKNKAKVVPRYELVKANAHYLSEADELRREIADYTERISTTNEKTAQLDEELNDTSKKYKEESRARNAFLKSVLESIAVLQEVIEQKQQVTDVQGVLNASDALEQLTDTVRTREKQLTSLEKNTQEHYAIRVIHEAKIQELKNATVDNATKLREQKDEAIREAVWNFQNERAKLHADIEDMKNINKEQTDELKKGSVQKVRNKLGMGKKSKKDEYVLTEEEKFSNDRIEQMTAYNANLRVEIHNLEDKIKEATKTRADAIRENQQLVLRMKKEKEMAELTLCKLDDEIQGTKIATKRVVKENDKIAIKVNELTETLKELKSTERDFKKFTKPLPTE